MPWTLHATGEAVEEVEKLLFAEIGKLLHRAELGPVNVDFQGSTIAGTTRTAAPTGTPVTREDQAVA
jgi:hypothetical protein